MTSPSAKKQLSDVWHLAVDDLMAMSDSEIDAELRELGVNPKDAAEMGKQAIEHGLAKSRARQRELLRDQMLASREQPKLLRDASITAEQAKRLIAQLQAANDDMLTLAARNRDPRTFSDEEALELYWKIQELKS